MLTSKCSGERTIMSKVSCKYSCRAAVATATEIWRYGSDLDCANKKLTVYQAGVGVYYWQCELFVGS